MLPLTAITTAAVLGGFVCGDHISPIPDTTILSSTGAGCNHINHVSTQMQYGIVVTIMSEISYIISGFTENKVAGFITEFVILIAFAFALKLK
jgi:Na+/H+ antiporter NhaC